MASTEVPEPRAMEEEGVEMGVDTAADFGERSASSSKGRGKMANRGGRGGRVVRESREASTAAPSKSTETGKTDGGLRRSQRLTQASSRTEGEPNQEEIVQTGEASMGDGEGEGQSGAVYRGAVNDGGATGSVGDAEGTDAESNGEGATEAAGESDGNVEAMSDEESELELPESISAAEELLKREYRRDSFACVNLMRRMPIEKFSKLRIPLCRMQSMPEVRATLEREIE